MPDKSDNDNDAAETDDETQGQVAADDDDTTLKKPAGTPVEPSAITKAYFAGFGNLGIADNFSQQWAAQLPDFSEFAKGLSAGIGGLGPGVQGQSFKFMDDKFLESIRGALDKQEAPFKVNLAKEALEGFNSAELFRQIRDSTMGTGTFPVRKSPSFFVDPTPTADLDIVRATIDAPDEPTTIDEVPAEVVTDIQITRVVIREEIVAALNEAFENRQGTGYWTNGRVAVLVGIVGVAVAVVFGILSLIF